MTEPKETALSASGIRIARILTILLVTLLAVNFGLVARAVSTPARRTSAAPQAGAPSAAFPQSPMSLATPRTTETADPSLPRLVASSAEASVEIVAAAPGVQWDDAEREAHVIPEPAELGAPAAAPVFVADAKAIAIGDVGLPEAPVDPPPEAPREVPRATMPPAAATLPPAAIPPLPVAIPRNVLILVNPPDSGGVIHYAIEDAVVSLLPGEYQQLDDARERRIRFHKGDDFGEAQHRLQRGWHMFLVGEMGWELRPADDNLARRLLNSCRPLDAER